MTEERILAWADAHHRRAGRWPGTRDGLIPGSDRETWKAVAETLNRGRRGCPGGDTLAQLLRRQERLTGRGENADG